MVVAVFKNEKVAQARKVELRLSLLKVPLIKNKAAHVLFTTLPCKPLSDQERGRYRRFQHFSTLFLRQKIN